VEFHLQNKFEKLVRLVGFIIRKFVTMHGHMNVKFDNKIKRYKFVKSRDRGKKFGVKARSSKSRYRLGHSV
jgi:hypothetical protein